MTLIAYGMISFISKRVFTDTPKLNIMCIIITIMIICVVKKITGQITDLLDEADIAEESKSLSAIRHRTF